MARLRRSDLPLELLLASALLSLPNAALAQCGCRCPSDSTPIFVSTQVLRQPVELAPNARIFARLVHEDPMSVALHTADGTAVPFDLEPAGDFAGTAYWIVPTAPLSAGDYVVGIGRGTWTAHVSGSDDTTSPAITGLHVDGSLRAPGYCSAVTGAFVSWDTVPADLQTDFVAEVELFRAGTLVARVFPSGVLGSADSDCLGAGAAPPLTEGETLTARVRVWDMAGNATPFVSFEFTPTRVAASDPRCAPRCTVVTHSLPSCRFGYWGALLLLGLAVTRRRRRRRRGQ